MDAHEKARRQATDAQAQVAFFVEIFEVPGKVDFVISKTSEPGFCGCCTGSVSQDTIDRFHATRKECEESGDGHYWFDAGFYFDLFDGMHDRGDIASMEGPFETIDEARLGALEYELGTCAEEHEADIHAAISEIKVKGETEAAAPAV